MLPVSREKHNAVVADLEAARTSLQEHVTRLAAVQGESDARQTSVDQLTEQVAELQKTLADMRATDLVTENERLTTELAALTAQVETLTTQAGQHQTELSQRDERIGELEQTIERLNNRGLEDSAIAASKGDEGSKTSLVDFINQNEHDTSACLQRLREEGF